MYEENITLILKSTTCALSEKLQVHPENSVYI